MSVKQLAHLSLICPMLGASVAIMANRAAETAQADAADSSE